MISLLGRKNVEARAMMMEKRPDMRTRCPELTLLLLLLIFTLITLETAQLAAANRQRPTPRKYRLPCFRSSAVSGRLWSPVVMVLMVELLASEASDWGKMKEGCTTRMSPRTGRRGFSELNVW